MTELFTMMTPSVRAIILLTALGFMALEYALGRLADHETHDLPESAASLGVAVGQTAIRTLEAVFVAIPFAFAYQHRLFDFDQTHLVAIAGLFLLTEFIYYWHHRASHRIRWMWATHAVHHSATKLNLTAAIRLGWTGTISGNFLFFLPLVWLGFHPLYVLGMLSFNLAYQFFVHTEFARDLGPLEWVLNTPAHHRVHHASNPSCLDTNYGGVLIVFDRLFGTFAQAPADEPLRYGLVGGSRSLNPVKIALGEWRAMFRDLFRSTDARAAWRSLFGPPGSSSRPGDAPVMGRPHALAKPSTHDRSGEMS